MTYLTYLRRAVPIRAWHFPSLLLAGLLLFLPSSAVQGQETPLVNEPLQTNFSETDRAILEKLVSIAQHNSPAVRDARYNRGLSRFKDAVILELYGSHESNYAWAQASNPASMATNDLNHVAITVDVLYVVSAFLQEPALNAHIRDALDQTRVTVTQNYIAYVQARQAARLASQHLNTVLASIAETQTVEAANLLQPSQFLAVSAGSNHPDSTARVQLSDDVLLANAEYVAAATEMLTANSDQLIALETLAASIGLPTAETLALIEQPTAELEQPSTQTSQDPARAAEIDFSSTLPLLE